MVDAAGRTNNNHLPTIFIFFAQGRVTSRRSRRITSIIKVMVQLVECFSNSNFYSYNLIISIDNRLSSFPSLIEYEVRVSHLFQAVIDLGFKVFQNKAMTTTIYMAFFFEALLLQNCSELVSFYACFFRLHEVVLLW